MIRIPLMPTSSPSFCVEFLYTDPLLPSGWYRVPLQRGKRTRLESEGPYATFEQAVLGVGEEAPRCP
jgi:hypothetical protein